MREKTIVDQVQEARTLIETTRKHPEIQKKLLGLGYAAKNLEQGTALANQVTLLQRSKREKYGVQYDTTDTLQADYQALKDVWEDHLKLARIAFKKQRGMQENLGLNEPRAKSRAQWTEQAANFYNKITGQYEVMARFGVTKAELDQAQAMVAAFAGVQNEQVRTQGEAQYTTWQRNEARKALRQWVQGFKAMARIALKDDHALLEILDITPAIR